jgi:hypothetical protein
MHRMLASFLHRIAALPLELSQSNRPSRSYAIWDSFSVVCVGLLVVSAQLSLSVRLLFGQIDLSAPVKFPTPHDRQHGTHFLHIQKLPFLYHHRETRNPSAHTYQVGLLFSSNMCCRASAVCSQGYASLYGTSKPMHQRH